MELERWVDLSKWQGDVPDASLRAMKADGITGICVGSWHGIDANPYVRSVLRRSRNNAGLDTATYFVFNKRPGLETVERALAACGQEEWDRCLFHAPDVEIRGITERILRDGINATIDAHGLPILYTGNWFWNWWKLDLGYAPDFGDIPSWIAVYNGRPDLEVTPAWGLGPMMIHQYTGSTNAYRTTVDFDVADKAWMDAARRRLLPAPPPAPPPTPEPDPPAGEEPIMGKILEQARVAAAAIIKGAVLTERELQLAKDLPAPIPGPPGPQGPAGKDATGGGTAAQYDLLTAADGHATGFAERHGISFEQLKVLNPEGPPSGNWNIVHAGERYRYA